MSVELSRTKKFAYSTLTTALYQLALFLAGFITPKVMLTFYSSEINGLVSSITQFITYFNLVEAGLSSATVFALYKPLAKKDYSEISSVVVAAKNFYLKTGYIFLGLITALAIGYPFIVESQVLSNFDMALLVFILGANSALEFFTMAKYRALLSADQKTYIISLASIVHVVLNTAIIFVLARFHVSIVVLRAVALVSIFVRSLILMLYVRKNYPQIDYKAAPNKESLDKRWAAMYQQVLSAIHTGAPVVILTVVVKDLLLVSVFSIYNMVITGLHGIMSIFSSGLSAGFGDVIAKGESETLKKTYQQFELGYLSVMTVAYAVAMVTIMPFIKIYTAGITDADYYIPAIGFLIVVNAFLFNLKSPQSMVLFAAGLYKESRVQATIQGGLMVVLGCIFGYLWGIEGILLAAIVSNVYRDIDLLFFIPKRVTKLPITNSLKRWASMTVCFAIIVLLGGLVTWNVTNYFEWAVLACVVGVIALVIILINAVLFDKEAFKGLLGRVKAVLGRTPEKKPESAPVIEKGKRTVNQLKHIIVDQKEWCTGCGVCAAVCPTDAIQYTLDDEGFQTPVIDPGKCIECGKCVKHCHLQSPESQEKGTVIGQYAVKLKDDGARMRSRSGGVFVALSDRILEQGGVVYGTILEEGFRVSHSRAETKEDRNEMCGSKYVQSDTTGIWEQLKADVVSGKPVLFTGTPCQIEAAYRWLGKEYENLYLCDFICHGVPSPGFWADYLTYIEKKYKRKLTAYHFRDKQNHPWESHVEKLSFGNKTVYTKRYAGIFAANYSLRSSCYQCPYTTPDRVSDFTIADYWGLNDVAPEFNDQKGVSLILVRGAKGAALFDQIKENLNYLDTGATPPSHYNLKRPTGKPGARAAFWADYRQYGFEYVSKKYGGYDTLHRIKRKIFEKLD